MTSQISEQAVFAAIADPIRREIVASLSGCTLPVNEIAARFSVSRPAVSRHLRVLREAQLVREKKRGRERLYTARLGQLNCVRQWLDQFWGDRLSALKALSERTENNNQE